METFVTALNTVGKTFVDFSLSMLIQSAALILVLLGLDLLLRKKVQAVFRYFLWLLVLAKLMLPTSFSAPTSLAYWLGDRLPTVAVQPASPPAGVPPLPGPVINSSPIETIAANSAPAMAPAAPINNDTPGEAVAMPQPVAPAPAAIPAAAAAPLAISLSWQAVVFIVWLAVAAAMVLLLLQRFFFVRGLIAQSQPAGDELAGLLDECRERMGLKPAAALKLSPNAASPSVCGLLRPVILLPQDLPGKLPAGRLRAIFLHELAHIKRGDLWVSLIQTLLQIAYFYHPLLWLANALIRRLREQAVDEMVLVALGEQAGEYPETLIDVSRLSFTRPALSLRLIGVVESKSTLAARIKHILSRPYPKSARLGLAGLLAILIAAAVLLPMAKAAYEEPEFIIKGTVMDAQTGQPIAGAKVGDNEKYNDGKFFSFTDPNGYYEYKTWYEEHDTMAEAAGYQSQQKGFTTKLFGSEKEKVINYELTPQESTAPSPFSATLPNGVTVELIGVCESPSEGKQWWRPDGTAIAAPEYRAYRFEDLQNVLRALLFQFSPADPDQSWQIFIPKGNIGAQSVIADDGTALAYILADENIPETRNFDLSNVVVGVAGGPWLTAVGQYQPGGASRYYPMIINNQSQNPDEKAVIIVNGAEEIKNSPQTRTRFHTVTAARDMEYELFCRLKSGELVKTRPYLFTGDNHLDGPGLLSKAFDTDQPADNIQNIIIKYRRFTYLTFQNVSLQPGQKTKVQIEIGKTDKDPQAAKRPSPMAEYLKMMETMMSKPESTAQETKTSAVPLVMVGTWFFDNPGGDDEQMAIFPDGRIVVLYSNGHRDETRCEDGKVALAEYGTTAELELRPDEKIYQHFTVKGAESIKIWNKINPEPQTELLRPLTEPQPNAADASDLNFQFDQDQIVRQLKEKIAELETKISELLLERSEDHPAVKWDRKLLENYQKQLDRRQNELRLLAILRQQHDQPQQEMLKQSSQNPTAQLPNGVTVELFGYSHWTDGKLEWFSPSGEQIQIPNVYEAEVDGLGKVIALRITPSDPDDRIYTYYYEGDKQRATKSRWQVGKTNLWLAALGVERQFVNLYIQVRHMGPWQPMETIPLDYKRLFPEKGKYGDVPIQRFHISAISGSGEKIPGTFSIKMGGYIPSLDLENFCAVDKKGNNHPQIDLEYYPKGNTVGEIYLRFDFPVEELAGITGRTREEFNSAVHFNNICLLPGMKSEVEMQIENLTNINDPNDMAVSLPDDIKADFLARKASAERRSRGGTSNGPQVSFECRILSIIDKKQVQNFLQEKEITQENPPHLIISDQDMEHLTQLTKAHKKSGFLEGPHFTVFSGEEAEISFAGREKRPGFSLKALPIVLEDTNRVNLSFEASEIRTDDSPPQTVTLETEMESGQILLALTPPGFMGQYLQEKDSPDSTILLLIKPSIIPPNTEQSTLTKLEEIFQPF